jgi:hypothetical protein
VMVCSFRSPPYIYRCDKGSFGYANNRSSFELTLGINEELPRWRSKVVELVLVVLPNQVEPRPASTLDRWLTNGPPSELVLSKVGSLLWWPLWFMWRRMVRSNWSMLLHFDPTCSFHALLAQIHLHIYFDQHLWNSLDKHPILVLALLNW